MEETQPATTTVHNLPVSSMSWRPCNNLCFS